MPGLVLFLTWRELQRKLGCGPALVFPHAQPRRIVSLCSGGKARFYFWEPSPTGQEYILGVEMSTQILAIKQERRKRGGLGREKEGTMEFTLIMLEEPCSA